VSAKNHNEGVIVQDDGQIQAKNVVAGKNASASVYETDERREAQSLAELREDLAALITALHAQRTSVGDPDTVIVSAQEAAKELDTKKPRKRVFLSLIETVTDGLSGLGGLVTAAEALLQAGRKLL
jgi:hypothetical protein